MADNYYSDLYNQEKINILKEICQSLFGFSNIKIFGYRRFYYDGRYLALCTDQQWQTFYFQNIKVLGSTFTDIINKVPYDKYSYFLWPTVPDSDFIISALHHYNVWNGITVYYRTKACIESFAFAGNRNDMQLQHFLINNLSILERFIDLFKKKGKQIIDCEDKKIFAQFETNNLITSNQSCNNSISLINLANKKMATFTPREFECLSLLSKGMSTKGIALNLNISPRTVETHLLNIKSKTSAQYKSELVEFFHNSVNKEIY